LVKQYLSASTLPPEQLHHLASAVAQLLRAARSRQSTGALDVSVTFRSGSVRVEVTDDSGFTSRTDEPMLRKGVQAGSFAAWIARELWRRRLSQQEAAKRFEVSLKTVNRWVNGRTEPRLQELKRVGEALGTSYVPS
jgi:ribosome-binding protein aMBF1 (putative translation factor)